VEAIKMIIRFQSSENTAAQAIHQQTDPQMKSILSEEQKATGDSETGDQRRCSDICPLISSLSCSGFTARFS
jgi:hypothetical protein